MLDPSEVEAVRDQIARGNPDAFQRILRAFGLPLRSYIAAQIHQARSLLCSMTSAAKESPITMLIGRTTAAAD